MQPGETFFIDQYTPEYSRSIEPMNGPLKDDYYYQLAAQIRQYKGARALPEPSAQKTIAIDGQFADWEDVGPKYFDARGDVFHRNHPGWGSAGPYINTTGRNDLTQAKVARDNENVYFYVRAAAPLIPPLKPGGRLWMTLYLDADQNHATGWEGYDYLIRCASLDGRAVVERCKADGQCAWEPIGAAAMAIGDRAIELALPRALAGLTARPLRFDFKWGDNLPQSGNILDWIDKGDAAPDARFNYRYGKTAP
jgi:hypothetical protein